LKDFIPTTPFPINEEGRLSLLMQGVVMVATTLEELSNKRDRKDNFTWHYDWQSCGQHPQ
jgi:hypothetical protein